MVSCTPGLYSLELLVCALVQSHIVVLREPVIIGNISIRSSYNLRYVTWDTSLHSLWYGMSWSLLLSSCSTLARNSSEATPPTTVGIPLTTARPCSVLATVKSGRVTHSWLAINYFGEKFWCVVPVLELRRTRLTLEHCHLRPPLRLQGFLLHHPV